MRFFKILFVLFFVGLVQEAFSQEALKSTEEEYYDFLSLIGITERPTLNYRTLSDSEWNIKEESENKNSEKSVSESVLEKETDSANETSGVLVHPWQNNNLGRKFTLWEKQEKSENWFARGINQDIKLKLYGPEWFNSYNTAAPYGQNDGALWQGKGYNTSLTAGARLEAYGFELTVKPQISFSENREFDYTKPNYAATTTDSNGNKIATIFNGKASEYGYYGVQSIDAPQRFGDSAFWTYDWGDTEARWSWNTFTVGFGTQTIWLGPAQLNPIIHSNNAASYPKFDIGIRKTHIYFPHFGWYLGDIEARGWWGKLTESDYFDNDDSNDNNLISGLAVAYKFPFTDLTIGFNRTMLGKWKNINSYSLFHLYLPLDTSGGDDENDQRFSFTADWLFANIGLELYVEWGRNDFTPTFSQIIRYPFHTQGWTAGLKKSFTFTDYLKGEVLLEFTDLESSRDYELLWPTTFYAHHIITQGYTNKGQWLSAGIGTGGNSQYLGAKLYTKKALFLLFAQRNNTDLDYTWYVQDKNKNREKSIRTNWSVGFTNAYIFSDNLILTSNATYIGIFNPLNDFDADEDYRNNFYFSIKLEYNF